MAVDNENKRRSVIQILPIPDGSIFGVDRQHAAGFYRGISALPSESIFPINVILSENYIHGVELMDCNIFNVKLSEEKVYEDLVLDNDVFSTILTDNDLYAVVLSEKQRYNVILYCQGCN